MLYLILMLFVVPPIAWFASEFCNNRALRITLGIIALCTLTYFTWGIKGFLTQINYNHFFGSATKDLIETSLRQIEEGRIDRVQQAWRDLNRRYSPTYENRADYDVLVAEAVNTMKQQEKP